MNNSNMGAVGERIATLRQKNNLSQAEFGTKLSDYMHRETILQVSTISAWETGRKIPRAAIIRAISELFNVSTDWLVGIEDKSPEDLLIKNGLPKDKTIRKVSTERITPGDLAKYHAKPVFVVFTDKMYHDQWGILDYQKKQIVFLGGLVLSIKTEGIELYPLEAYDFPRYNKRTHHPMSIASMKAAKEVWVEINTADDVVRSEWNGWYVHNKQKTALVNISNGNILPYRGYGKTFKAFHEPYDIVQN